MFLYTNFAVVNCAHYTVSVVDSTIIHNLNSTNETTFTTAPYPPPEKKLSSELRETHGWPWRRLGESGPLDSPGQLRSWFAVAQFFFETIRNVSTGLHSNGYCARDLTENVCTVAKPLSKPDDKVGRCEWERVGCV